MVNLVALRTWSADESWIVWTPQKTAGQKYPSPQDWTEDRRISGDWRRCSMLEVGTSDLQLHGKREAAAIAQVH